MSRAEFRGQIWNIRPFSSALPSKTQCFVLSCLCPEITQIRCFGRVILRFDGVGRTRPNLKTKFEICTPLFIQTWECLTSVNKNKQITFFHILLSEKSELIAISSDDAQHHDCHFCANQKFFPPRRKGWRNKWTSKMKSSCVKVLRNTELVGRRNTVECKVFTQKYKIMLLPISYISYAYVVLVTAMASNTFIASYTCMYIMKQEKAPLCQQCCSVSWKR